MGGGERGSRGCEERETELMRGRRRRRKRKRRLEERTRRRQEKSFKSVFLLDFKDVIMKMTADDNSGPLMDLLPICCSLYRNKHIRTVLRYKHRADV